MAPGTDAGRIRGLDVRALATGEHSLDEYSGSSCAANAHSHAHTHAHHDSGATAFQSAAGPYTHTYAGNCYTGGITMRLRYIFGFLTVAFVILGGLHVPSHAAAPVPQACVDLVPTLTINPTSPGVGQPVDITVTVRNEGNALSGGFYVFLYVDPADQPPEPDTPDTSYTRLFGLPPGGQARWTYSGYTFTTPGCQHVIYAWVDRDDEVAGECHEDNNLVRQTLCVAGGNECPDSFDQGEGDNTCANAVPLPPTGAPQHHTLCPVGDEDWVRFQAQANTLYSIEATNVGEDADIVLEAYDACTNHPAFTANPTLGRGARLDIPVVEAGTYYVRVKHHDTNYGQDTGYDLSLRPVCSLDLYEPDDTCSLAVVLPVDGPPYQRSFCQSGDEDWFQVDVVGGRRYRIILENLEARSHPRLSLYTRCNAEPVLTTEEATVDYTADHTGPLYLRLQNADPARAGLDTGYTVRVQRVTSGANPHEPNDVPAHAVSLLPQSPPLEDAIDAPGDVDWFTVDAREGYEYVAETFDLGPGADTYLCLYASDATTLLSCDDDSGEGLGSRLRWRATYSGQYYLKVRGYDPEAGGAQAMYKIAVNQGRVPCQGDAFEPDNVADVAPYVTADGTPREHTFCPEGDVDWARVEIRAPGTYLIETRDLGAYTDTLLELYDTNARTRLFSNDDYGPGFASRILWTFQRPGVYFLKARPYDTRYVGRTTHYTLRIAPSSLQPTPVPVSPTPTPTPEPTSTPTPTPTWTPTPLPPDPVTTPAESVRTFIVTHLGRWQRFYGEAGATRVRDALQQLAAHPRVQGRLLDLAMFPRVEAFYRAWDQDPGNVARADAVAQAIRQLLWTEVTSHQEVRFIVIVGDDRIVPFYRAADHFSGNVRVREADYGDVSRRSTVGQALQQNVSLTDDYYAALRPRHIQGRPLFLADLAIGRLVETPQDVEKQITTFLDQDTVTLMSVFVASPDNHRQPASAYCDAWRRAGIPQVDCSLVGGRWRVADFLSRHLNPLSPYQAHFLEVPGRHWRYWTPQHEDILATQVHDGPNALARSVVAAMAHHSGLNVPVDNPYPMDWPQAYARQGAIFVGQTGYSLLLTQGVGLTDELLLHFATELAHARADTIGEAWVRAKHMYWLLRARPIEPDRKVLHIATFYGLPMYRFQVPGVLGDEYPSVSFSAGAGTLGGEDVYTVPVGLALDGSFSALPQEESPDGGTYRVLDGHAVWDASQPPQPYFAVPLAETDMARLGAPRGVVWLGGRYLDVPNVTPPAVSVAVPADDAARPRVVAQPPNWKERGWLPPFPALLDRGSNTFATRLGQFHGASGTARLYDRMDYAFTFSDVWDTVPPRVSSVAARVTSGGVEVKVAAEDASGVAAVMAVYTAGDGQWRSVPLRYRPDMDKWVGRLPARQSTTWFVQVIDGAGNVARLTNKDRFYSLDVFSRYVPYIAKEK